MKEPLKRPEQISSAFAIRKVVTERVNVNFGSGGEKSPGQMLDELLAHSAKEGEEVNLISFEITPADWGEINRQFTD